MRAKCDFSGWATKNDLKCSDGRTIRRNAFKDDDGRTVPLVWQHQHNSPENVLGHAILENRDDGVYAYCSFNESESAKHAKELVRNKDITQLSIYANKLEQKGGNVLHGCIREVSLVLAGANPGAMIEFPILEHSDGDCSYLEDEATIYSGILIDVEDEEGTVSHADEKEENADDKTVEDVFKTFTEEQKNVLYYVIAKSINGENSEISHADEEKEPVETDNTNEKGGKTIRDVFESLNEEQKKVFYFLVGQAVKDAKKKNNTTEKDEKEEMNHSYYDEGGTDFMTHNVFENETETALTLSHDDMKDIFANGQRCGSLKASVEAYADVVQHSIEEIDVLFPDYKALMEKPELLNQQNEWVTVVLNGVKKSPFSRVKSSYIDITADEARAKGYVKGNKKVEEVVKAFKRTTGPQTIYKLQKLDRDDILDITDFDVVAYMKAEMRLKLNEELARQILVGDGRLAGNDKIDETCIRPIWKDSDIYTIHHDVIFPTNATAYDVSETIVDETILAFTDYMGKGGVVGFIGSKLLAKMRTAKDVNGRRIYKNAQEIADAMGVNKLVEVPLFDQLDPREDADGGKHKLLALFVNLSDYNQGADKGGQVTMFEDFDIDYNKNSYLIETRCSGALVNPYVAVAIEEELAD